MERGGGLGRRRPGSGRGVSFGGFVATLAVLLVLLFGVLEFVNRWTRIPDRAAPAFRPRAALDLAARALTRDLSAAVSGRFPVGETIRPVGDNVALGPSFQVPLGESVVVRPGTDEIGVRGILRSPGVGLEPLDRATRRPVSAPAGREGPGEIQARPASARLKLYSGRPPLASDADLAAVNARLGSRSLAGPRKRFFVAGDAGGAFAVARVSGLLDRTATAPGGCPSAPDGCHLELTLDFTDADAVRLNRRGATDAAQALGPVAWGGLLDEIVYFVARGPQGRPPDYFVVNDPPTLAFPHPFLAAAEWAGGGLWDVVRVADDVENLQAAYSVASASRAPEEWRADRAGARPLSAEELSGGEVRLRGLRIALVAKGTERRPPAPLSDVGEDVLPFNAPRPDRVAAPVGWSPNRRGGVDFDRETRFVSVRTGGAP